MAKVKFTQSVIDGLQCPAGRKDALYFDSESAGFACRVSAKTKTFLVQYRVGQTIRRVRIGRFGQISVEQARRQAKILLGATAAGGDPHSERKAKARVPEVADSYRFGAMVEDWAKARSGIRRPSYLREAMACLKRHFPTWLDKPAASVSFAEAADALDSIRATKSAVAANRALAYGRACYGWAVRRRLVTENPMKGLDRPGQENPRERVLTLGEVRAIWRASDSLEVVRGAFVKVLLLTGQRVGEVERLEWSELDSPTDPTVWTLPASRAKNGRTHVTHLSEPARAAIRSLPRVAGCSFVFAGKDRRKALNGGTHTKEPLEAALKRLGTPIKNWRLHDFRRAMATALADRGVAPHVCDRLLNHVGGTISGVAAVYQRAEFLSERAGALDAWGEMVTAHDGA